MKEQLISEIAKNVLPAWNDVLNTLKPTDHENHESAVDKFIQSVANLNNNGAGGTSIRECKEKAKALFEIGQNRSIKMEELEALYESVIKAKSVLESNVLKGMSDTAGKSRSKNKTII